MDRLIDLNPRDAEPVNAMSCKRQSSRHSYLTLELKAEHQGEFPVRERSCVGSKPYFFLSVIEPGKGPEELPIKLNLHLGHQGGEEVGGRNRR
jgi:hypothetical protein